MVYSVISCIMLAAIIFFSIAVFVNIIGATKGRLTKGHYADIQVIILSILIAIYITFQFYK